MCSKPSIFIFALVPLIAILLTACDNGHSERNNNNSYPSNSTPSPSYSYPTLPTPTYIPDNSYRTNSSNSFSPDDAYDEGYDEGYEAGLYDGRKGRSHGYSYDDSSSYYNYYE